MTRAARSALGTLRTIRPYADVVADGHVREQGVVLEDRVDVAVERRDASSRPRRGAGSGLRSAARSRRSSAASWSCPSRTGRASRRTRRRRCRGRCRRRRRSGHPAGTDDLRDAPPGVVVAEALDDAFEPDRDGRGVPDRRAVAASSVGIVKQDLGAGVGTGLDGRVAGLGSPHCAARPGRVKRRPAPFRSARRRLRAVIRPIRSHRDRRRRPAVAARRRVVGRAATAGRPGRRRRRSCPARSATPREVNIIAKDYSFLPDVARPRRPARRSCSTSSTAVSRSTRRSSATPRSRTPGRSPRRRPSGAPPGPDAGRQRPAGRRRAADRRRVRASGSTSSGRSRPRRRPTPAVDRRLPHPRPLGDAACRSRSAGSPPPS